MISRWYISVLILGITVFGVVSQKQVRLPNQEIVLQFEDPHLSSQEAEDAVALVKGQLQDLGAKNIEVLELDEGKLKITYYSDTDIVRIRETFSKSEVALQLTSQDSKNSTPIEHTELAYDLSVYEIQSNQQIAWDYDGATSLEFELKSDRFLDPDYFAFQNLGCYHSDTLAQVAHKVHKAISIELSEPVHTIPEVRAGPIS